MLGILERFFGCSHKKTTFPMSRTRMSATAPGAPKAAYIVCLECGQEFEYDWQAMKIGGPAPALHFTLNSSAPEEHGRALSLG